jgi:hypothetical protein
MGEAWQWEKSPFDCSLWLTIQTRRADSAQCCRRPAGAPRRSIGQTNLLTANHAQYANKTNSALCPPHCGYSFSENAIGCQGFFLGEKAPPLRQEFILSLSLRAAPTRNSKQRREGGSLNQVYRGCQEGRALTWRAFSPCSSASIGSPKRFDPMNQAFHHPSAS